MRRIARMEVFRSPHARRTDTAGLDWGVVPAWHVPIGPRTMRQRLSCLALLWLSMSMVTRRVSAQEGQDADVCLPKCRTGYVCVKGSCVSACNPACSAHEECTPDGECVAAAAGPVAGDKPESEPTPPATQANDSASWSHAAIAPIVGIGAGLAFGSTLGTVSLVRVGADIPLGEPWYLQIEGNLFGHSLAAADDPDRQRPQLVAWSGALHASLGHDFSRRFSVRAGLLGGWGISTGSTSNCGSTSQDGAVYGASATPAIRWGKTNRWEFAVVGHVMNIPDAICVHDSIDDTYAWESGSDMVGSVSAALGYAWW